MSSLNVASSTSALQQAQWSQPSNPWQQLSQALQSGNLQAAQQAFATLPAERQPGRVHLLRVHQSYSSTTSSSQNPLQALAQALQSGNLSAAQQAFSQLQQAGSTHHHHHHGQGGGSASAASGSGTATTASAAATTSASISGTSSADAAATALAQELSGSSLNLLA